jgi:hypothetical protein
VLVSTDLGNYIGLRGSGKVRQSGKKVSEETSDLFGVNNSSAEYCLGQTMIFRTTGLEIRMLQNHRGISETEKSIHKSIQLAHC